MKDTMLQARCKAPAKRSPNLGQYPLGSRVPMDFGSAATSDQDVGALWWGGTSRIRSQCWRSASAYFPSGILHPPLTLLSFDHCICGNIILSYTMSYPVELLWEVTTEALHCPSVTGGIQSRSRSGALSYWLSWFILYDWLFLAPLSYLGEVSGSVRHFKVQEVLQQHRG